MRNVAKNATIQFYYFIYSSFIKITEFHCPRNRKNNKLTFINILPIKTKINFISEMNIRFNDPH